MPTGVTHSAGDAGPRLRVPADACDCHMHVLDDKQILVPWAVSSHASATLEQYEGLQRRLGISRFVIVQPSVYGLDHSVLLSALQAAGPAARGVAVVDDQTAETCLAELAAAGVRGARLNLVQRGTTSVAMLEAVSARVAPLGWHLQVHARPAELLELESRLAALPVPVVLDHIACVGEDVALQSAVEQCLRRMLGSGRVFLKLSGPYFSARDAAARDRLGDVVARLVAQYVERLLWGSDWPHATESPKPDDAVLMNDLLNTASSTQVQAILVSNPAMLYGFDTD